MNYHFARRYIPCAAQSFNPPPTTFFSNFRFQICPRRRQFLSMRTPKSDVNVYGSGFSAGFCAHINQMIYRYCTEKKI